MIAPDPANPGTIYLGGGQGGIWKTTNNGTSWTPLTDDQPDLAIGAITVGQSGIIYAGTGESGGAPGLGGQGGGILSSTNGGAHWTPLGISAASFIGNSQPFGSSAFNKIIINPNNSENLLASTTRGVWSSTDGGSTWNQTLTGYVSDLIMDPVDPMIFYAPYTSGGSHLEKSINGGLTWTAQAGWDSGPGQDVQHGYYHHLAISPAAPSTIFALTTSGSLWKNTAAGVGSWSDVQSSIGAVQGSYDLFVDVDPTNVNTIYVGLDTLFLSVDSGASWTALSCCGQVLGSDFHAFAFNPKDPNIVYVGDDAGAWTGQFVLTRSTSCSEGGTPHVIFRGDYFEYLCWNSLNSNLDLTLAYSLGVSPTDAGVYILGSQDTGAESHNCNLSSQQAACANDPTHWRQLVQGDGGWTGFDPNNPSIIYYSNAPQSPGNIVTMYRSSDGGNSQESSLGLLGSPSGTNGLLFPQIVAIDPSNSANVYAVGITSGAANGSLLKSGDMGTSWGSSPLYTVQGDVITSIAVATTNGQYIYFGTYQGKFFSTANGGSIFHEEDTGLPPKRALSAIAVDPSNPRNVAVSFEASNTGGKHIYYSMTAGTSWTDISGNLPDLSANALVFQGGSLFVGLDQGVYTTPPIFSGLSAWTKAGKGLPNTQVAALDIAADGSLVAATFGRGVWTLPGGPTPTLIFPGGILLAALSATVTIALERRRRRS